MLTVKADDKSNGHKLSYLINNHHFKTTGWY